jgi:hypothetical protein
MVAKIPERGIPVVRRSSRRSRGVVIVQSMYLVGQNASVFHYDGSRNVSLLTEHTRFVGCMG